ESRDHVRWNTLGTYLWPNSYFGSIDGDAAQQGAANNHPARTYRDEVQFMRQWLHDRLLWMDSQFLVEPTFSQSGGNVAAGTQITITGAAGSTVYYTLDGSDPRLPGGGLNPTALAY